MTTQPTPPAQPSAGWYPDPQLAQTLRYWDGASWTEHRAPQQPGVPAGYQPAYPQAAPATESMTAGYVLAVLLPIVGLIYGLAKWRVGGAPVVVASIVAWVLWSVLLLG